MLDRSVAPSFVIPVKFEIPEVETITFDNGVDCHFSSAGNQSIVKLELHFKGGKRYDDASFNSFFTSKLLTQGTKTKSADQIAEVIAFHGAYLEIISGNEKVIITLFTITKHLQPLCDFLNEILTESTFREEDLTRIKSIELQNFLINQSKTSTISGDKFRDHLFPNHYYGSGLSQSTIEGIDTEKLKKFHSEYLQNTEMEIFVSGLVSKNCLNIIENSFGQKQYTKAKEKTALALTPSITSRIHIEKEDAVQSSVRFGFQTINKSHPDYYKFSVCNEILGGYFGSRLMNNIREDKGYTYGIGSYLVQLKYASYFQISTDVKSEFAQQTVEEIEKEIDKLATTPVSQEELVKVRNYLFGSFASSLNTPFDLMDKFKTIHALGVGYEFYHNYFDVLKNITAEDILVYSNKYLKDQQPVVVTCG